MKRILYDNPAVLTTSTTTTSDIVYGSTIISVTSSTGFVANDYVLVETQGHELNEIRKISVVNSSTQITLSIGINYKHATGAKITKLAYDSYKITKSVDGGVTYTTLVTAVLNYSDEHNKINYVDTDGLDSYYYKIYYINTYAITETLQATINSQDNFSYCTISDFMAETGISTTYSSYAIDALIDGVEFIKSNCFIVKDYSSCDYDTIFSLNLDGSNIVDFNGDRVINKDDIIVYEYNPATEYVTYLASKLIEVKVNNPKVIFNENVPTAGSTLFMKIPTASLKFDDMRWTLKELNKLLAANYLLKNSEIDAVKTAVLQWTAGGTTVNKEPMTVISAIEKNDFAIRQIIKKMAARTYFKPTKLRTRASSLNMTSQTGQGNFTFSTPGGNMYRW